MFKAIYKYPLGQPGLNRIRMPRAAKPLSVQMQREIITLWALVDVDPGILEVARRIYVYGTGWELRDDDARAVDKASFIGTVQVDGAAMPLVFHVFDGGE